MIKAFYIIAVGVSALLSDPAIAAAPPVRYFPHPGAAKPFSSAVRVGNVVFVSGATGYAPDGSLPTDFAVQAAAAMDAMAAEFKLAGASMDDIYKCGVALTDMSNWAAFNGVYTRYFKPGRLPVRMAIGVSSLGGAAVEIQCEAALAK